MEKSKAELVAEMNGIKDKLKEGFSGRFWGLNNKNEASLDGYFSWRELEELAEALKKVEDLNNKLAASLENQSN